MRTIERWPGRRGRRVDTACAGGGWVGCRHLSMGTTGRLAIHLEERAGGQTDRQNQTIPPLQLKHLQTATQLIDSEMQLICLEQHQIENTHSGIHKSASFRE